MTSDREKASQEIVWLAQQHAMRFTSAFMGADEFHDLTQLGTGTFVRLEDRTFLITASHCVQRGHEDPAKGFVYLRDDLTNVGFSYVNEWRRGGRGDVDEEWDIAAIEVHDELLTDIKREALTKPRLAPSHEPTDVETLLVVGATETDKQETLHPDGRPALTIFGNAHLVNRVPEGAVRGASERPNIDLFLRFPAESRGFDGRVCATPSPKGLSGGGVWALNMKKGKIWDPNDMTLIGIVRSSHVKEEWLRATRIRHWLDFVRERAFGVVSKT